MEQELITNNNVALYYYPNKYLHKFCISLYIKAGTLYEKKEDKGISHFWEHLIYRNIDNSIKTDLKKKLDKIGAYFNACTYKELIVVDIIANSSNFNECVKIITKIFEPYNISKDDFEVEKKRIKSEIREDNDKKSIEYIMNKSVWKGTNMTSTITGSNKSLDRISLDQIEKFNKKILTNNNIFFYVTGSFSDENISNLKKSIEKYELTSSKKEKNNVAPVPKNFFNRDNSIKIKKGDYTEIAYSFDIDSTKYSLAELDLLYSILFHGECSKIHQTLSNKTGLIYSYNSALELYKNIGHIYFSYEVKQKRLLESIERVVLTLKKLKSGLHDELDFVKPSYHANAEINLDEPERLNWIMGYEKHILRQDYKDIDSRKKAHDKVTKERMNKIINEILVSSNLVIAVKTEKKKDFESDIKKIIKKL